MIAVTWANSGRGLYSQTVGLWLNKKTKWTARLHRRQAEGNWSADRRLSRTRSALGGSGRATPKEVVGVFDPARTSLVQFAAMHHGTRDVVGFAPSPEGSVRWNGLAP